MELSAEEIAPLMRRVRRSASSLPSPKRWSGFRLIVGVVSITASVVLFEGIISDSAARAKAKASAASMDAAEPAESAQRRSSPSSLPLLEADAVANSEGSAAATRSASKSSLEFLAMPSNEYTAQDGPKGPGRAYPWLDSYSLVEPHRHTVLALKTLRAVGVSGWGLASKEVIANELLAVARKRLASAPLGAIDVTAQLEADVRTLEESGSDAVALSWSVEQTTNLQQGAKETRALLANGTADASALKPKYVFDSIGDYRVSVRALVGHNGSADGGDGVALALVTKQALVCRYVRRDIRRLNADDRNLFLDAARTMFEVSSAAGIAKFGGDYREIGHFVALHLDAAVPHKHADRMHDGMGFLSQHIAISGAFERSIQAIAPRASLCYWDFTVDAAILARNPDAGEARLWTGNALWTNDVFGNATGKDHFVRAGRWGETKVPLVGSATDSASELADLADGYTGHEHDAPVDTSTRAAAAEAASELAAIGVVPRGNRDGTSKLDAPTSSRSLNGNAYGVMRAPWNLNPSPYLTRYHDVCGADPGASSWPTCHSHHDLTFNTDYETLGIYMHMAQAAPHGFVHEMIGGVAGCSEAYKKLVTKGAMDDGTESSLQQLSFNLLRDMWRYSMCDEPENSTCTFDGQHESPNPSACKLQCKGCGAGSPEQTSTARTARDGMRAPDRRKPARQVAGEHAGGTGHARSLLGGGKGAEDAAPGAFNWETADDDQTSMLGGGDGPPPGGGGSGVGDDDETSMLGGGGGGGGGGGPPSDMDDQGGGGPGPNGPPVPLGGGGTGGESDDDESDIVNNTATSNFTYHDMEMYLYILDKLNVDTSAYSTASRDAAELVEGVFCESPFYIGEQIEAASPIDISFWPIHPTLERLFQYKMLAAPFSDLTFECTTCWDDGYCLWGSTFNSSCEGHYPDSPTTFAVSSMAVEHEAAADARGGRAHGGHRSSGGFGSSFSIDGDGKGSFERRFLTNEELLALERPNTTRGLTYIYENFHWDHCEALGISFPSVDRDETEGDFDDDMDDAKEVFGVTDDPANATSTDDDGEESLEMDDEY